MSAEKKSKENSVGLQYARQQRKRRWFLVLAVILLLVFSLISLFLGSNDVRFPNLLVTCFPSLSEHLSAAPMTNIQSMVLWKLRLPRIVSAVIVGASLAVCGTIMQATTGNVMASPYTTGISSAAALGAAIGILFHPFGANSSSTIICAFLVGMFDAAMVYGVTLAADLGAGGMILIGVALHFMFGAANSLLQYVANEDQLSQIVHWTFGSLTGIEWKAIIVMGVALVVAMIVFMRSVWSLNIMASSGDESARSGFTLETEGYLPLGCDERPRLGGPADPPDRPIMEVRTDRTLHLRGVIMNYYNGLIFRGFLSSLPGSVLSGGQYDNLMRRLRRRSGAVGFAVYLDQIARLDRSGGEEAEGC